MSEPRVTITLGGSGQVVKRGGESGRSISGSVAGSKRSMGGARNDGNDVLWSTNKRQRGNGINLSTVHNRVDNRIAPNDLRLKLIRERELSKKIRRVAEERKKRGLLKKLSEATPSRATVSITHGRPGPGESNLLRLSPPTDLRPAEALRNYYSPTINESRADNSRGGPFSRNEVVYASRPTGLTPIPMKAISGTAGSVAKSILPKSSHMMEEPITVASLLHSLGLEKYIVLFQAEEVDMTALKQMGDKDLKELGIPMGPRKKILLALLPRSKQQPP